MAMAEDRVNPVDENYVDPNIGTRSVEVMKEDGTTTTETFLTANEEYFSTRIQSMMESRSEFKTALEREIEASKEHWSELPEGTNGEDGSSAEKNLEMFRSLQQQFPNGFFKDWDDDVLAVGEKIAEGAQGEIFKMRFLLPKHADLNDTVVLKVFKLEGWSLQDLQKQWPPGMLLKKLTNERGYYDSGCGSAIWAGMMLNDGRFAFAMVRYWGDLRKVIDLRMELNDNQAPPFSNEKALQLMLDIAAGMRALHKDNIVHRDLKASNVLICPREWVVEDELILFQEGFNPTSDDDFDPVIADFECSHGVWGTRFWRAPEILMGVKNRDVQANLFTEKSDVYSYAMTCYEVLTGKIPLEDLKPNNYDAIILQGARPRLPSGMEPWIESLLSRCWNHDPSQRPSFEEIVEKFESNGYFEESEEE